MINVMVAVYACQNAAAQRFNCNEPVLFPSDLPRHCSARPSSLPTHRRTRSNELFGRPALLKLQGKTRLAKPTIEATVVDEIKRKDNRRHYVRVRLETHGGETFARLTGDQGSGILLSLVRADGIAILPEDWQHVAAGTRVNVMMLDWAEV